MSLRRKMLDEAREHLRAAKEKMEGLASLSEDWTARSELLLAFEVADGACREFALFQLGMADSLTAERLETVGAV